MIARAGIVSFLILLCISACRNNNNSATEKSPAWAVFTKADSVNPVMNPDPALSFTCPMQGSRLSWAIKDVFNPAAVVRKDTVFLLFRAEDSIGKYAGTSRIGLAWSPDGFHFSKYPEPVLYPDHDPQQTFEWEGGCEDPRIVKEEKGSYIMTYTGYDGLTARLMVASSPDLRHWTKQGPAFSGKYRDNWSKSGSIVCSIDSSGEMVATRIGGKYCMYWGDTNIWMAESDDLVHWEPVREEDPENQKKNSSLQNNLYPELKIVLEPRPGMFDSDLVEPGPPALMTREGIFLLYNGRNRKTGGDDRLQEGTYSGGQALLDKNNPSLVLQRSDTYFITPDRPYEITGQVNRVCFIEGLVHFHDSWLLYYGTADSKIAVATAKQLIEEK